MQEIMVAGKGLELKTVDLSGDRISLELVN